MPTRCNGESARTASDGGGSRFESWCGHPFIKTEHVRHRRGNGPENRCAPKASRVRFSGAPPISTLRSSTAEHSPDKRETVERHHAEGPFLFISGWLRQMSGGPKIRRGGRATHSSGQFRGIDVTGTCESSKLDTSGQHRHAAPIHQAPEV